ncbi:nucleoside hydrolase [Kaistia algarum]|uniref:nucleoside hydrolase n=1 Tax=Kaistia algarum TaxID=2083279 RepID=UPI000CE72A50|nr:nucleoside hydrolase [Kaistia algarum]MCX5514366.1 nucleoside hydrolase [Kaistia algarum]PPE79114.1 nucleoside hydrolase [Kaistia algarum]
MAPRKVIILTDPGQDQAVALLMAFARPDLFDVLGLVATAGNIDLSYTVGNCLKLLELAGRPEIPVFAGCLRPIKRDLVTAAHVHGPTGLDGYDFPEPAIRAQSKHGVDFIIETLRAAEPGDISIFSLSPLTNLGVALIQAPEIAGRIREIVMMAGAYFEVGNITPTAEFNVYVDPEAADVVLRSGIPMVMLPLDVTHQMRSTRARLDAFSAIGNRCGAAVDGMMSFSEAFDLQKYGWDGAPLHGPCVPAYMMKPELFESRLINVTVETGSELTLGMTVADWWQITNRRRNVTYVRNGDPVGYYDLMVETISRLP